MTFEEMAAQRDPLYAAMQPMGAFDIAVEAEKVLLGSDSERKPMALLIFISALHELSVRAMRNDTL